MGHVLVPSGALPRLGFTDSSAVAATSVSSALPAEKFCQGDCDSVDVQVLLHVTTISNSDVYSEVFRSLKKSMAPDQICWKVVLVQVEVVASSGVGLVREKRSDQG